MRSPREHVAGLMRLAREAAPAGWLVGRLGIVGAGMMGTAIAAAAARCGIRVLLVDHRPAARAAAPGRVAAEMARYDDPAPRSTAPVETTGDLAALADCAVVLESVAESLPAKHALFARLEPCLAESAWLATNTSTLPIGRLASALARPERFCGLHFFHPVHARPLVEIVRGPATSPETLDAARRFVGALGRMSITTADAPGFLVNRLLQAHLGEALSLLVEGVPPERIERVATGFGMAKGPLALLDEIGLDTALAGGQVLHAAWPERVVASPVLVSLVKAGRLGRKSGAGFFTYPHGEAPARPAADPVALEKIAQWAEPAEPPGDARLLDRLLLGMVVEAARLLDEGVVAGPREVDLGTLFGLGFPAARGGLLYWADTRGAAELVGRLSPLRALGPRFQPPPRLLEMARTGRRFHAG